MLRWVLCVMIFVGLTVERPIEHEPLLYSSYWRSPFGAFGPLFVSLPGLSLWAWQVMLFLLAPFCLLRRCAFRRRAALMDATIFVSLVSVGVTFAWGVLRGGSAYEAYYQLWRFLTALLLALLLLSVVDNSRDLKAIGVTILAASIVRATLVIYFYWVHVHGKIIPPPPHMSSHDDSLLFTGGLVILASGVVAIGRRNVWLTTVLSVPLLLYAMVLNNRRLVWIELVLALAILYVLLPRGRWRRSVTLVLPAVAPLVLAYLIVGANRPGPFFAPARALSSAGSHEDTSSLARQEEVRNLLYTLSAAGNPVLGTGWGRPYIKVTSVFANFDDTWTQYLYQPHNSLLGVAVFAGLIGIGGIWLVVPVAAFLATRGYRASTVAAERAAALAAVCILPPYSAQCFGDIGFQSLTGNLILGAALGVAGKVPALVAGQPGRGRGKGARSSRLPRVISADEDLLPGQPRV